MKKIAFVSMAMLLVVGSLFSDNVKALGSSFSLLIPDNYEDVKSFPDRLNLEESAYTEVGTNSEGNSSSFIGISPFMGNFRSRHEFTFMGIKSNSVVYDESMTKENSITGFNNYFGLGIGSLNLGIKAGVKSDQYLREERRFDMTVDDPMQNNYLRYSGAERSFVSIDLGISSSVGDSETISLAANYHGFEEYFDYSNSSRSNLSDNFSSHYNGDSVFQHEFRVSLIKDMGEKRNSRILAEILYTKIDDIDMYNHDFYNQNSDIKNEVFEDQTAEGREYGCRVGIGTRKRENKAELFSGLSFSYLVKELDRTYSNKAIEIETIEDSTITSEDYFKNYNSTTDKVVELTLPLGLSYSFTEWFTATGSITIKGSYTKEDLDFAHIYSDPEFQGEATQNISLEFYPTQKLELGIYNMGTLSQYKNWEVTATYLF